MNPEGHLTAGEVSAFCQSADAPETLTPTRRLAISDHLAECAACRALVAAAAAEKPADGRRRLFSEIQGLAQAATKEAALEQENLEAFTRNLETFPEEHFRPGDTLPASGGSKWTGVRPHRRWSALFSWPVFVTAGAAAVVMGGFVALVFLKPKSEPTPQTARAVPLLKDGPVLVAADGSLHASADFPDELRNAMIEVIARRALRVPGGMTEAMRGGSADSNPSVLAAPAAPPFPLLPIAGSTVETRRPLLQWNSVPTATDYQVEITSSATTETLLSPRLPRSRTNWQPETDLVRGRIYHWRVLIDSSVAPTAGKSADEMTPVSFKVLSEAGEEELRRLRAASPTSHFALAITCVRLGLFAEARQEMETLRANNPHSVLAMQLLDSLR